MSILKSGGSPPFFPLPRSRDRWRVMAGPGGSGWVIMAGPHVKDLPLLTRHFGGGGGLGCHLAGFPPTQGIIVFCLILLNYMTSGLYSCFYILLLTQPFFLV
jgi:hypothetical protein